MLDPLVNKGTVVIGDARRNSNGPIVVVGCARGGTSMVAGVLSKLGVFLGDKASAPVFEDVRLANTFEDKRLDEAQEIVKEYTRRYGRWAWKRPSIINHLEEVERIFESPLYIFVYKDILSIANRNAISMLMELLPGMEIPLVQYGKTIEFIRKNKPRALLISYEKAITRPHDFVRAVADFCGLPSTDSDIEEATRFVAPDSKQYLEATRITKAQGRLGGVSQNRVIFGWAKFAYNKKPAEVEFFINDELLGNTVANRPREDLLARFNQPCAYAFKIPDHVQLREGDVLRARVRSDIRDLENSPFTIEQVQPEK